MDGERLNALVTILYSIFPPWRLDTTSLQLLKEGRTPVVIVQGFLMRRESMYILDRRLKEAGFAPISFNLRRLGFGTNVPELARILRYKIESLFTRKLNGFALDRRIPAIGYSMGGIILHWIARYMDGAGFIDRVITIGSPVNGFSWVGRISPTLGKVVYTALSHPLKPFLPSLFDLWEGSELMKTLRDSPFPPSCFFLSISSEGDFVVPPRSCALPSLPNTRNVVLKRLFHSELPFSDQVAETIIEHIVSTEEYNGYFGYL